MFKLLSVELLKIRRSLALFMMVGIPLLVVAFNVLIVVKRYDLPALNVKQWAEFRMNVSGLWCYFMMPLYIALVTGLLNGLEHKNQTWRLMFTLPVAPWALYAVKALLAWLFVVGACVVLVAGYVAAALLLGLAGAGNMQAAFDPAPFKLLATVSLASLPIVVIQHAVSWRFQNLVLPLALGVIATMGILQIGSSKYWIYYPWSYAMMAAHGSDGAMQQKALLLSLGVAALLFAVSTFVLGRRETEV
ncbi:MAG: ABC transporter permease [Pseudomonadota bacterium]